MDIKFNVEGFNFNVRSSCIIKDKTKEHVLVSNMRAIKDHEAFLLPGGRAELLENTSEAIERELNEELGLHVNCKLISIDENIVKETKFHMIEFVYYTEIDSFSQIKTLDDGWDKFKIIKIEDVDKYDIRPKTVKTLIKQEKCDSIAHNINYDWAE